MVWKKLGKIFDPTNHTLPNQCREYAKSPQVLVNDNFVRIYFCTVQNDENDKSLSHISFVDFDLDFSTIIQISNSPVISLGELGCFDEHGIFPINVVRDEGRILAYTTGWSRRTAVSVETSVGLAISENNGESFTKLGSGPVLTSSLHEPFLVCDSFVAMFNNIFHMWYIYGIEWIESSIEGSPQRVYKIAHATSVDGVIWAKEGKTIIPDKLNVHESQALPSVIYHNGLYHMYFCYREATDFRSNPKRAYKIGYAYSQDLSSWTREDDKSGLDISETGWDSEMQCYPHIFHCNNKVYLLYNGNEFGRYGFGLAVLEE